MTQSKKLKEFVVELFKVNGVKFGDFKTKVGLPTPVYCDLRVLISYPKLLDSLTDLLIERLKNIDTHDCLCGVPYTALPIATILSIKTELPMVMRRQEAKNHGTKKLVEGHFNEGDRCLIIEDVVTSGSSILETVRDLKNCGLKCTDVLVLLNREQGGEDILKEHGIKMHALLSMTTLVKFLHEENLIDDQMVTKVLSYIKSTQVNGEILKKDSENRLKLQYIDRIPLTNNPVVKQILSTIVEKESNLCVAADVTTGTELLNLAEQVGPHICLFKTHIDIIEDFNENLISNLLDIAKRHKFLIFEDRKFADIGKTVELQFKKGIFHISSWAKIVTAHSSIGKSILNAIRQSSESKDHGVFLVAEISSADNLITESYTKATLNLAKENPDLVVGVVSQSPQLVDSPGFLQLTPGVQLDAVGDHLGQCYSSPENVMVKKGADIAVVGRGITQAADPAMAAMKYRKLLWEAYLKRV